MEHKKLEIHVPASTSNLGPGFDCLGLALDFGLQASVETTGVPPVSSTAGAMPPPVRITVSGSCSAGIAMDETNLVYGIIQKVHRRAGRRCPALHLHLKNEIPLARGLGSSGAAIVAGLKLGHQMCSPQGLAARQVLDEAVEIEGHPDNVAPALYGGFCASFVQDANVHSLQLPFNKDLKILLLIPDIEVSTQKARAVLPQSIALADATHDSSRIPQLLHALGSTDASLLRLCLRDRMHSQHRLELVPGLRDALQLLDEESGCLGTTLSGSGPTVLAFFHKHNHGAGARSVEALRAVGIRSQLIWTSSADHGARWA